MHERVFRILKFRTMKVNAPHDIPTHMLDNPDQYITRVGRFLRKASLDEMPQLFNILVGDMSIIGPRPALWNQGDLIAERNKYGANDVRPGLTGWAQINGRDELEIPVKARLDGEYIGRMSFFFDCRCFCETVISVITRKGIVEGTGVNSGNSQGRDDDRRVDTLIAAVFNPIRSGSSELRALFRRRNRRGTVKEAERKKAAR